MCGVPFSYEIIRRCVNVKQHEKKLNFLFQMKKESLYICSDFGVRLILSDDRMKRESGENPEQYPLL